MTTTTLAAPTAPARRRAAPRRSLAGLRRGVSPLVAIAVWQLLSTLGAIPPQKLAAPSTIASTFAGLVADGTLVQATAVSLQRVVLGFALGATVAIALALVAGLSRAGEDAVDPVMMMLRTLPHLGLVPLLIIWLGIGEAPKIALIALGVTFPLYLNTVAGIRGIDRRVTEAARAMRLTWAQRVRHVVLPGALPQVLTGLRQSLGIAWLSLIVAESISAHAGLGYLINNAREFLLTDVIVVGLAVYSLLGLGTDAVVRAVERRALSWR